MISPLLLDLYWLPVHYCIMFKVLLLVYKSLNGTGPGYLADLLHYRSSSRSLQSMSNKLLTQPRTFSKTYGDKAFSVCAPRLWNNLPLNMQKSSSIGIFKQSLKTYLFSKVINSKSLFL